MAQGCKSFYCFVGIEPLKTSKLCFYLSNRFVQGTLSLSFSFTKSIIHIVSLHICVMALASKQASEWAKEKTVKKYDNNEFMFKINRFIRRHRRRLFDRWRQQEKQKCLLTLAWAWAQAFFFFFRWIDWSYIKTIWYAKSEERFFLSLFSSEMITNLIDREEARDCKYSLFWR